MKLNIFKFYLIISSLWYTSCDFVKLRKVSTEEINNASVWSNQDQYPLFQECQDLIEEYDQKKCFEEILLNSIYSELLSLELKSKNEINSEIIAIINIDEQGLFSLESINDPNNTILEIDSLEKKINKIISNLPKAVPAIKTNVGSFVKVKFSLPINISTISSK